MYSIQEVNKALFGGILKIEIVPVEGIDSMPEIVDSTLDEFLIILKSGYSWTDIPILDNSATYEEEEIESSNGISYSKRLSSFLPHDLQVNRNTLQSLKYKDLVVKYKDRSGSSMLIGTIEEPVQLAISFRVGELGGQLGYPLQLRGQHTIPALFLTTPALPQFSINELGQLIYQGDLEESFALNSDGEITVTGAQEGRYSLDSRGRIVFA